MNREDILKKIKNSNTEYVIRYKTYKRGGFLFLSKKIQVVELFINNFEDFKNELIMIDDILAIEDGSIFNVISTIDGYQVDYFDLCRLDII